MMRGAELKAKYSELLRLHHCRPISREVLALLSAATAPQVINGIASSPDVDAQRMSFAPHALIWSNLASVPLLLRHDAGKVIGRILDLHYDDSGRLRIEALVEDAVARRMPALSIAATVVEAETINAHSPSGWHFRIRKAVLDECSLTDKPSCSTALILSRRDVGASDTATDDVLASVTRCRAALEQLRAAWSSNAESKAEMSPAPSPQPTRTAPAHIITKLPQAILKPRRSQFADLVARLPIGG
ncbi:hypothetical protein [Bradyrhizobium sp. 604_D8_N2_3]|uniref:hypothetical protein n=1 Tax=Bradyrhizobium sp. 604_D8_N2_3 TaxID=3240370 RepID=UPI003F22F12A